MPLDNTLITKISGEKLFTVEKYFYKVDIGFIFPLSYLGREWTLDCNMEMVIKVLLTRSLIHWNKTLVNFLIS